ncbi:ATP-binding protein [Mycolicibacterium brumae]|uniref:ATP-binding protein n=1 Tax=Mycolicibacterium brumae TaxID=85968 RepID=A0A2G5P8I4_9MYCO|nr:ATP-binding protein [Mycolicibacterium brumae]MCV7194604.1 ATP-binding protein [Mycolicibacterium brumae]PIB74204.1 ATP-binding protein [Mycolicibacterium brumae]RWA22959.1 hypothetical protein MBRU_11505 [Mycolicibacterium brumae DSM 44177]UWW08943.1 ATP-binding protein [Mycolicibacterium brumae]
MVQQRSPYTPGSLAHHLPGRDAQLERVNVHLTNLSLYRQLDGRVHVFVGPRGVGKTSLLRAVQSDADRRTFTTAWVTGGDTASLAVELANEFERISKKWTKTTRQALIATLKTVRITFGGASVQLAGSAERAANPGAARLLQQAMVTAGRGAVEAGAAGLVVFVDELQSADPVGIRALAYAWQHMQAEADDLPAAVFAAGLGHTQDVVAKAVSFGERFEYGQLTNLDERAARAALADPALAVGVAWEPAALDLVLAETKGYPQFIQEFGDKMWEAAGYPGPGGVLATAHIPAAMTQFTVARNAMFRSRWTAATPAEQKLLIAMAALGEGDIRRKEVADAMGVGTAAIGMARQSLMDKGLIEAAARGRMRFTAPGFGGFIREFVDTAD